MASSVELLSDEVIHLVTTRLGFHDGLDRLTPGWQLLDHRQIQVTVGRQGQRPRDRCRRHDQDVGIETLRLEDGALQHAEAMLLVDDRQAQCAEGDGALDERMRADHQLRGARGELGADLAPRRGRRRAGQQPRPKPRPVEQPTNVEKVLLGQDFRRRHEGHLQIVFHCDQRRQQRHDGLARANVSLQ